MTMANDYNEWQRRARANGGTPKLELSAESVRRLAELPAHRRTGEDADRLLRWAADQIAAQAKIIVGMRQALRPFALAASAWRGADDLQLANRDGVQLTLGHCRVAYKAQAQRIGH